MQELLFSITYPPIPITQVGPISLSLHGVFAAIGFYFGAINWMLSNLIAPLIIPSIWLDRASIIGSLS